MFRRKRKEKRPFGRLASFLGYLKLNEDDKPDDFEDEFRESELRRQTKSWKQEEPSTYRESVQDSNVYDFSGCKVLPLFRLEQMLRKRENKFSETLLEFIDESGMKDSEVYKKAGIDRKHFSKIRNNKEHMPKKVTVFSFAIALELSIADTERLLESAGYALSNSYELDIILKFFIQRGIYDRYTINEILEQYQVETIS